MRPTAGSNSGCLLQVMAYLTVAGGWWNIGATDTMGLAGNWTSVSGSILGRGGGSQAKFTNAQIEQVLRAYSCFSAPQAASGYVPVSCSSPSTLDISATDTTIDPTAESNNFTNGDASLLCDDPFNCVIYYDSSAP